MLGGLRSRAGTPSARVRVLAALVVLGLLLLTAPLLEPVVVWLLRLL